MTKTIYVAGGCFWGVEHFFKLNSKIDQTCVGYLNSTVSNPSYQLVCTGKTNATEAVKLVFDNENISISEIVEELFQVIDPYSLNKQGNDIGTQYRTGIYTENKTDLAIVKDKLEEFQRKSEKKIQVEALLVDNFYPAEEYHQNYLEKNPTGYCHIPVSKFVKR